MNEHKAPSPTDRAKARADRKFHRLNGWYLAAMLGLLGLSYLIVLAEFLSIRAVIPTIAGLGAVNVAIYLFSHRLAVWLTGAKRLEGDALARVEPLMTTLLPRAGLSRAPTLYAVKDDRPNAFAFGNAMAGHGVAVTDGILKLLSDAELQADAFSAEIIGSPDPLIVAFIKFEEWAKAQTERRTNPPLHRADKLLISHPGMGSRILALGLLREDAQTKHDAGHGAGGAPSRKRLSTLALTGALAVTAMYVTYRIAPVLTHAFVFENAILRYADELVVLFGLGIALTRGHRYWRILHTDRLTLTTTFVTSPLAVALFAFIGIHSLKQYRLMRSAPFAEIGDFPNISGKKIRFTPQDVATQEMVRRVQSSEFSPGHTRALGGADGVGYIAPYIPQGLWNSLESRNNAFIVYDDAGPEDGLQRVRNIPSEPFVYGEGMKIFDDVRRRLIVDAGFFNSYPEIYYAPIVENGAIKEVIGVVPYVSYQFRWGIFVPYWGGVAIFRANGDIRRLTPEEALSEPMLAGVSRLYPESLAKDIVIAQRYDQGLVSGLIRRPNKIKVPKLPGHTQMPFFLTMDDGSSQYVTTAEPDGSGSGLMRVYLVDARTGERSAYRFDEEGRPQDLLGPTKATSSAKAVQGFNWYEEEDGSGSYRVIEPRPITREGILYWMLSIVPVDYARVVATVFVDAKTSEVVGPFRTRAETYAWLSGQQPAPATKSDSSAATDLCGQLARIRQELEAMCPANASTTLPPAQ
jgi:hypothetical protein